MLARAAHGYCRQQHARSCGYELEDNYRYSRKLLRGMLPAVFGGDIAGEGSTSIQRRKAPQGADEVTVMLLDVKSGLERLTPEDRQALWEIYGRGHEGPITHRSAYDTAQTALARLQKTLGGPERLG